MAGEYFGRYEHGVWVTGQNGVNIIDNNQTQFLMDRTNVWTAWDFFKDLFRGAPKLPEIEV